MSRMVVGGSDDLQAKLVASHPILAPSIHSNWSIGGNNRWAATTRGAVGMAAPAIGAVVVVAAAARASTWSFSNPRARRPQNLGAAGTTGASRTNFQMFVVFFFLPAPFHLSLSPALSGC